MSKHSASGKDAIPEKPVSPSHNSESSGNKPDPPEGILRHVSYFLHPEQAPGPGSFYSISLCGIREAGAKLGLTPSETMIFCLEHGIWPSRFKSNRGTFSNKDQITLLRGKVAIIGCGGLGGYVGLILARLGIGALVVCDGDVFAESNLNRQAFCREDRIGTYKALAAREDLQAVASHLDVRAVPEFADTTNLPGILNDCHAVVDCLDDISARRMVEQAAHAANIPFIHGAIAGLEGFALISLPPKARTDISASSTGSAVSDLYGSDDIPAEERAEYRLGVSSPTPVAVAVLQTLLTLRFLTGKPLNPGLLHIDLAIPEIELLHR